MAVSQPVDDIQKRPAGRVHVGGLCMLLQSLTRQDNDGSRGSLLGQWPFKLNKITSGDQTAWPRLWWLIRNELNVGWKRVCQSSTFSRSSSGVTCRFQRTAAESIGVALFNSCVVSEFQWSKRHMIRKRKPVAIEKTLRKLVFLLIGWQDDRQA